MCGEHYEAISSKKALKGAGIFKYYSYLLLEILTIICPLAAPIVALFGVRLAKNVNENGKILHSEVWNGLLDLEERYGKEINIY